MEAACRKIREAIHADDFKRAVKLAQKLENNHLAMILCAYALMKLEKIDESIRLCDQVMQAHAVWIQTKEEGYVKQILYFVSYVLKLHGEYSSNVRVHEEVFKAFPNNAMFGSLFLESLLKAFQFGELQTTALKLAKAFPENNSNCLAIAGVANYFMNNLQMSEALLKKANDASGLLSLVEFKLGKEITTPSPLFVGVDGSWAEACYYRALGKLDLEQRTLLGRIEKTYDLRAYVRLSEMGVNLFPRENDRNIRLDFLGKIHFYFTQKKENEFHTTMMEYFTMYADKDHCCALNVRNYLLSYYYCGGDDSSNSKRVKCLPTNQLVLRDSAWWFNKYDEDIGTFLRRERFVTKRWPLDFTTNQQDEALFSVSLEKKQQLSAFCYDCLAAGGGEKNLIKISNMFQILLLINDENLLAQEENVERVKASATTTPTPAESDEKTNQAKEMIALVLFEILLQLKQPMEAVEVLEKMYPNANQRPFQISIALQDAYLFEFGAVKPVYLLGKSLEAKNLQLDSLGHLLLGGLSSFGYFQEAKQVAGELNEFVFVEATNHSKESFFEACEKKNYMACLEVKRFYERICSSKQLCISKVEHCMAGLLGLNNLEVIHNYLRLHLVDPKREGLEVVKRANRIGPVVDVIMKGKFVSNNDYLVTMSFNANRGDGGVDFTSNRMKRTELHSWDCFVEMEESNARYLKSQVVGLKIIYLFGCYREEEGEKITEQLRDAIEEWKQLWVLLLLYGGEKNKLFFQLALKSFECLKRVIKMNKKQLEKEDDEEEDEDCEGMFQAMREIKDFYQSLVITTLEDKDFVKNLSIGMSNGLFHCYFVVLYLLNKKYKGNKKKTRLLRDGSYLPMINAIVGACEERIRLVPLKSEGGGGAAAIRKVIQESMLESLHRMLQLLKSTFLVLQ